MKTKVMVAGIILVLGILIILPTTAMAQLPFIPPATSKTSEPQNQIPEGATAIVTEKGTVVIPAPVERGNTIILPPAYLIAKNGTIIMLHEGPSPGTAAVGSQVIQLPPIVSTTTPSETRTTVIHDHDNNNNNDHNHKRS